ncbi:MAG: M20/M25/M40 family metallo-hydrolase [Acidobacteria bacterium]|nr:M20/M25/M40 family metallo-hydrolase [Acidobacteriota bacterium]
MRVLLVLLSSVVWAQSPPTDVRQRIRDEGLHRSQIMQYATELLDDFGPRLTGSTNLDRALEWARAKLQSIGLQQVRTEPWGTFGLGWQERHTSIRMLTPVATPLTARAAPWSPATPGAMQADLVTVSGFSSESQFDAWRGKLQGKAVLYGTAPSAPVTPLIDKPLSMRLTARQLADFASEKPRATDSSAERQRMAARFELMEKAGRFFAAEGVVAVLVPSGNNAYGGASGGTLYADTNYTFGWHVYRNDHRMQAPMAILAVEDYLRLHRMQQRAVPVKLELNIATETMAQEQSAANLFAEIPGTHPQRKQEQVLVNAHLDSWTAGTGATDDGAGVLIAMEAMRILQAVGAKPDRTIRLILFTGEEQGALGSRAFVRQHLADIPDPDQPAALPEFLRGPAGPPKPKPAHAQIAAVYTLDAGGGKIRGVSTGNPATVDLFRRWLAPLRDLGVTMVAGRSDCGGDCASFQQAGLPAPSFKQDPLEYDSRTHHTSADTYERLAPDDLRQAAVVVATMLYETAMHRELLPR